jgi:hypothetical protein
MEKAIVLFVSFFNKINRGINGKLPLFHAGFDGNGEVVAFTKNQHGGVLSVRHSPKKGYYWVSVGYTVDETLEEALENAFSNASSIL